MKVRIKIDTWYIGTTFIFPHSLTLLQIRIMAKTADSDFLIQFGKQLEKLRKKKDLSYRKLAQNCSIDYSNISKIEKGTEKANITMLTLLELAKGLEIHPKKLLDFDFEVEE